MNNTENSISDEGKHKRRKISRRLRRTTKTRIFNLTKGGNTIEKDDKIDEKTNYEG